MDLPKYLKQLIEQKIVAAEFDNKLYIIESANLSNGENVSNNFKGINYENDTAKGIKLKLFSNTKEINNYIEIMNKR